jgi:uncharacterized protein (TIGR02145 family)
MNIRKIIAAVAICVCLGQAYAQVYVSASATDDNGAGTSWETAKQTIAAGLSAAGSSGTVFVAAGTYNITAELTIPSGVTVMGGYTPGSTGTDTSQRHLPGTNSHWTDPTWCTIIVGAGYHRIATVQGLLDGCVMSKGSTTTLGGGVLINGGTVRYCVIKDCDAISENTTVAEGGGAYIQNNGTLLNCVVMGCRGDKGAGVAGGNGNVISNTITRNSPVDCGLVADYDGNIYKTLVFGDQCWMRENLRTTHYSDGTVIPLGSNSSEEPHRFECFPSDLSDGVLEHCGYLYNWAAVMNGEGSSDQVPSGVQGICPSGWHVPSNAEWDKLGNYVSSIPKNCCDSSSYNIAKSLASTLYWNNSSYNCAPGNHSETNNASRFAAYPAGYCPGYCTGFGNSATFWSTSLSYYSWEAYSRVISFDGAGFTYDHWGKYYGCSVRCVKD